jgi:integrase
MLQSLPKKSERIFGKARVRDKIHTFKVQRIAIARKVENPRLEKIHFHTLRHWKGTMEYHKTHDPDHVKRLLGHRNLQSTEIYINMEQAVFSESDQEFHVKLAKTIDEACKLLEVGFEFVTDMDGAKLFRKRK